MMIALKARLPLCAIKMLDRSGAAPERTPERRNQQANQAGAFVTSVTAIRGPRTTMGRRKQCWS